MAMRVRGRQKRVISRVLVVVLLCGTVPALLAVFDCLDGAGRALQHSSLRSCEVAAYYFPQWHVDPVNVQRYGREWTEWEVVAGARPRFHGHTQPKLPDWGFQHDDDPAVMARKIDTAVDHGIGVFLFDWYYSESGQFLAAALERGFLNAPNIARIKFAIMWANHRLHGKPGEVSPASFDLLARRVISEYFKHPSYWRIDSKPYFSIYEIDTFVKGMGGLSNARAALDRFRMTAAASGLPGVHVNVIDWQLRNRPDAQQFLHKLDVDSITSYAWVHVVPLHRLGFPAVEYDTLASGYMKYWDTARTRFGVPYFPNVTMGWDPTPRMDPKQPHDGRGYPNTSVVVGNTPARFKSVLLQVRDRMDLDRVMPCIITVNAWNEWTEGSYLEPDAQHGMGYLEAIRDVFGKEVSTHRNEAIPHH